MLIGLGGVHPIVRHRVIRHLLNLLEITRCFHRRIRPFRLRREAWCGRLDKAGWIRHWLSDWGLRSSKRRALIVASASRKIIVFVTLWTAFDRAAPTPIWLSCGVISTAKSSAGYPDICRRPLVGGQSNSPPQSSWNSRACVLRPPHPEI
jgi:hypothetical protein